MEDLLRDVADISFAAERAGLKIDELNGVDDRAGRIMTFIYNLARNVEDYLDEFQNDKSAELEIGFLRGEGVDPWSLFGEKP